MRSQELVREVQPSRPAGGVRRPHRPASARRQRGSVTAETAVLLPVLMVVLAAAVWALACLAAQLQCVDAARAAARAAARGDASAVVRATAERVAPDGARVLVGGSDDTVEVEVRATVAPFGGLLSGLASVPVSGRAAASVEPGRP